MPPTIATPTRSKGSDCCCGNSMYWFYVGSNMRQTWRTTIWNQEKLKYLLVSLRSPHETSQPYNSHREGQKTTAIQISVGPGKINPHVELVLRLSVLLALRTIWIAKIKPDLSFNGKQSWFIVHKILLNSTNGKKKHMVRIYSLRLHKTHSSLLTWTLWLWLGSSQTKNLNLQ